MKKITNILILIAVLISSSFFLSACTKKSTTTTTPTKTETAKQVELSNEEKPYINLIPRADGHELKLKITNIPSKFSTAEYELIYTAEDEDMQIEKGVSGTVKLTGSSFEKDLLLGTSSCTNGCKYKYDEGITGGVLSLTLTTNDKQYVTFETPFNLKNSAEINKAKSISLTQENFSVKATTTSRSDFFIVIKNFKPVYSVFSNGNGNGKITSIEPSTITKENLNSLVGDYLIP
jgi:hypothetical protein